MRLTNVLGAHCETDQVMTQRVYLDSDPRITAARKQQRAGFVADIANQRECFDLISPMATARSVLVGSSSGTP
jgi:hypothetical protein